MTWQTYMWDNSVSLVCSSNNKGTALIDLKVHYVILLGLTLLKFEVKTKQKRAVSHIPLAFP